MSKSDVKYRISRISFGLLSPEEIRKIGKIEISSPDTYDEMGMPIEGGVLDPRLGITDPTQICKVCGNNIRDCPGHFGRIELTRPVLHIGYIKDIKNLLNSTCSECNRILIPEEERKKLYKEMVEYINDHGYINSKLVKKVISKASKVNVCPHCGKKTYKVKVDSVYKFIVEHPHKRRIWPNEIRERLQAIQDEDVLLLGFNPERSRPENAVLTVMLVPPLTVRPSVTLETGDKSEDDLTHKLADIVRVNKKLDNLLRSGSPNPLVEEAWDLLQYHIATFYDNTIAALPVATQRGTRPIKSLFERWSGKDGRFRNNLIGKRVDFSSRTVISPDPMINIDEVGVPVEIAKILTIPEPVNEYNIETLKEAVLRGEEYPGANYVIKDTGERIRLTVLSDRSAIANELKPSYIVERHIRDGDTVIFNRHPSLHKLSILSHKVKILPHPTFRLHPAVCTPYNADFDGDEMNVHVPQSYEARIEADELLSVEKNLISPRVGGAIVGGSEDFITISYLLTKKGTYLDRNMASLLLTAGGIYKLPEPEIKEPKELWSGKQIFSLFLPEGINYEGKASTCIGCDECVKEECPYDAYVKIENSQLKCGVIDNNAIGVLVKGKTSLLDLIIRDKGEKVASNFISKYFRALSLYIRLSGVTMSLSDIELPEEAEKEIYKIVENSRKEVEDILEKAKQGRLTPIPGLSKKETLEANQKEGRKCSRKVTSPMDSLKD